MEHDLDNGKNLKLVLSTFEQLPGLSIRANSTVMGRQRISILNMRVFLDAKRAVFLLNTWVFPCTIGNYQIVTGN
jgi:hypothetical protein